MLSRTFRMLTLLAVAMAVVAVVDGDHRPAGALEVVTWSDDSSGADTVPATTISALTRHDSTSSLVLDASEDGRVLGAIWSSTVVVNSINRGHIHGAVGWTDGTTIKWSTPTVLNANTAQSAYYRSMSVSGDGRTIYVTWIESNGTDDDVRYAIGAISVDPSTNAPSVTWGATQTVSEPQHQWYPTIETNHDGTKVVLTYWSLVSSTWHFEAEVATVAISGASRTPTWKGPARITTPSVSYTTTLPRLQVKLSRDGNRAIAVWWNPDGLNTGYGKVQASVADIGPNLPFPASLSGSAWGPSTTLSTAQEANVTSNTGMPSVDFDDAGIRAVVSWKGDNVSDNYVSARVATLSNATTATWSPEVKVATGLSAKAQRTRANISADGSRVFVGWGTGTNNTGSHGAAVGSVALNGTPTWSSAVNVQVGAGQSGHFGAVMSRDGTTAVMVPMTYVSSARRLVTYATNIWETGGQLQTDWGAQSTVLSDSGSVPDPDTTSTGVVIAKDGTIALAHWGNANMMFSRATVIGGPVPSSIAPSAGDVSGGTSATITGTGFRPGATVTIGGVICTNVVVVSTTTITCTTGSASSGTADVIVTNPNNASGTMPGGFTFQSAQSVTTTTTALNSNIAVTTTTVSGTTTNSTTPTTTTTTTVQRLRGQQQTTTTTTASSGDQTSSGATAPDGDVPTLEQIESLDESALLFDSDGNPLTSSVAPGAEIAVRGIGFKPGERVSVLMGTATFEQLSVTEADNDGVAAASVAVPESMMGAQTLALYGQESKHGVRSTVNIAGPDASQTQAPLSAAADAVTTDDAADSGNSSNNWLGMVGLAVGLGLLTWFFLVFKRRKDDEDEPSRND